MIALFALSSASGCGEEPVDCYETHGAVAEAIWDVQPAFAACAMDSDCTKADVYITCGSGGHGFCGWPVAASQADAFVEAAEEAGQGPCVPGCTSSPTCIERDVVCEAGACAFAR